MVTRARMARRPSLLSKVQPVTRRPSINGLAPQAWKIGWTPASSTMASDPAFSHSGSSVGAWVTVLLKAALRKPQ